MRSRTPRRGPASCLALLSVLVSACAGSSTPTEPSVDLPVRVSEPRDGFVSQTGLVLDFRTYVPLPGARVVFGPFTPGAGPEHATVADASGLYRIEVPPGDYRVSVDGVAVTPLKASVSSDLAHLFARAEGCSAIYGVVADARSGSGLPGVVVSSGGTTTTTKADGWYRLDFGCDVNLGFNTMYAYFTRDGYESGSHVVGRGAPRGALRIDMGLQRATSAESE